MSHKVSLHDYPQWTLYHEAWKNDCPALLEPVTWPSQREFYSFNFIFRFILYSLSCDSVYSCDSDPLNKIESMYMCISQLIGYTASLESEFWIPRYKLQVLLFNATHFCSYFFFLFTLYTDYSIITFILKTTLHLHSFFPMRKHVFFLFFVSKK